MMMMKFIFATFLGLVSIRNCNCLFNEKIRHIASYFGTNAMTSVGQDELTCDAVGLCQVIIIIFWAGSGMTLLAGGQYSWN